MSYFNNLNWSLVSNGVGKEEEFMKEKCKSEFEKGVASRQEYVYTDIDMKREIEKTQKEIGNKISEPKECVNII